MVLGRESHWIWKSVGKASFAVTNRAQYVESLLSTSKYITEMYEDKDFVSVIEYCEHGPSSYATTR